MPASPWGPRRRRRWLRPWAVHRSAVGMATAAAYGHALGVPVHGVVQPGRDRVLTTGEVLVVTDARRREVYWARYRDGFDRRAGRRSARRRTVEGVQTVVGSPSTSACSACRHSTSRTPLRWDSFRRAGLGRRAGTVGAAVPAAAGRKDARRTRRAAMNVVYGPLQKPTQPAARSWRCSCSTATIHGRNSRLSGNCGPATTATSQPAPTTSSSATQASPGWVAPRRSSTRSTPSGVDPAYQGNGIVGG